ncbi:MAG: OmpA family protein [Spirochaetia bacterium]|nr:OmpA family protein [Spirochaetia bacterium]
MVKSKIEVMKNICLRICIFIFLLVNISIYSQEESDKINNKSDTKAEFNIFDETRNKILRWRFNPADILEIKKYSNQEIIVNDNPIRRNFFHRVILEVREINNKKGYLMKGRFFSKLRQIEENNAVYKEEISYPSMFYLAPTGVMDISGEYLMPNVRNIPSFPEVLDPGNSEKKMKPNDTWLLPGYLAEKNEKIFVIPLDVKYEYKEKNQINTPDGLKTVHKIHINYQINYKLNEPGTLAEENVFGFASAVLLWDEEESIPYAIQEEFNIVTEDNKGNSIEIKNKTKSIYKKIKPITAKELRQLGKQIEEKTAKLPENQRPKIKESTQGLIIELPDILFEFNSSNITEKNKLVLNELISILKDYSEANIKIIGHTDNKGSVEYNLNLSEERAKNTVNYLLENSNIVPEKLSYEGMGSTRPIDNNNTEEGRQKNRRVEIIILDK